MRLSKELNELKKGSSKRISAEKLKIMQQAAANLAELNLENGALKQGGKIPSFVLKDALGRDVSSDELLSKSKLIISFYRGGWCPYCNLELRAYQRILSEIKDHGGVLVAISPELPDASLSLQEKHSLEFPVLSDIDNLIARQFGLVFSLEENLRNVYKSNGYDLPALQGNDRWEIPIPATYVVGKDGIILYSYVNSDYRQRIDPEELLDLLSS